MLTVLTPPTVQPVSVADIETALKFGAGQGPTDDLKRKMLTAIEQLQQETERQFCEATLVLTLDRFPSCGEIELWVKPVQSITHIKYYNADNTLTTVSSSDYALRTGVSPAVIQRPTSVSWPSSLYDRVDAVVVTFVAGEAEETLYNVPEAVRECIIERVKSAYYQCDESPNLKRLVTSLKWTGLA